LSHPFLILDLCHPTESKFDHLIAFQ